MDPVNDSPASAKSVPCEMDNGRSSSPDVADGDFSDLPEISELKELSNEKLLDMVVDLLKREKKSRKEKHEQDEEFGRHRAMFKEMYMQKEGEIGHVQKKSASSAVEFQCLREDYGRVQLELAELKSVALVAESASRDEMKTMKERYQQELASMEQAMRAMIEDAEQSVKRKFGEECSRLTDAITRLRTENEELTHRLNSVDRGLFASLGRKVGVTIPGPVSPVHTSAKHLQQSRSPSLDEESYNRDMKRAKDDADILKSIVLPLEEQINVLKSQLQEANDKVQYYEQEKLKLNFQSKESLDSLARKFGAKEFDLSTASKSDIEMYFGVLQTQKVVLQDDAVNCRRELGKTQKLLDQERELTLYLRKCLNNESLPGIQGSKNQSQDSLNFVRSDSMSLRSGDESPINAQLLDLSLTPDFDSLSITTPTGTSGFDDNFNSSHESTRSSMRENGSNACIMCSNYESQLQAAQKVENKLRQDLASAVRVSDRLKADLQKELQFREDMDSRITKSMDDSRTQISDLYKQLAESEKLLKNSQDADADARAKMEHLLREMALDREKAAAEMDFLSEENDRLVDRYGQNSRQMQDETINLPTEMTDLHLVVLQYRDDIIRSKVAKEHMEDTLRNEILFLKDQLSTEQQNKDGLVDMLSKEIDALREKLGIIDSEKSEIERQHRTLTDQKLAESSAAQQVSIRQLQNELSVVTADKTQLEKDLHHSRSRAQAMQVELDNSEAVQRDFVKLSQSLQVELEKIRQSENEVRWQFDDDVFDCNSCGEPFLLPKKKVRSLKIHCRHCGKIFCHDCLSKEALSGPNRRAAKVCDVCHTILNRDTAPYFSRNAPSQK